LIFEKSLTINVANVNEAPTGITLTGVTVPENSPGGTVVGQLSATDFDPGDTSTFSLIGNTGGHFEIIGTQLQVATGANLDFAGNAL